ncbi:MAG: hypothetical protein HZB91_01545 [Elusimicrobia bacterium]|nr:hypothetical protein [Elusimicrobiota bacterium]
MSASPRLVSRLAERLFPLREPRALASACLLLALVSPLAGLSGYACWSRYEQGKAAAVQALQDKARLSSLVVAERLDKWTTVGRSLAARPAMAKAAAGKDWAGAMRLLRSTPEDFPDIESLFLCDPAGTLHENQPPLPGVQGRNFAFRDWYTGVSYGWRTFVSPAYLRADLPQVNVVAVAEPIRHQGRVVGILVLRILLETIGDWAKELRGGTGLSILIVDQKGQVLFHPDVPAQGPIQEWSSTTVIASLLRGERGWRGDKTATDKTGQLEAYEPVPGYGWGVVVARPAEEAFRPAHDAALFLALACGLATALTAAGSWLVLRLVAERMAMTEELQAANKELETFSYSVSHDLRAPLRAIEGFSKILLEDHAERLDQEGKRVLAVVQVGVLKMARLIDDLLAFSRLGRQAMSKASVDMTGLAGSVLRDLMDGGPGPPLQGQAPTAEVRPMPPAWGDAALMRQVYANLISNALKFSRKAQAPRVEVGSRQEGAQTVYFVRDNGAGFDMRYADKLFGVFQRLHGQDEFEGTGVGLAVVHRIVTRHGGRVRAQGKVGEGAEFAFILPGEES